MTRKKKPNRTREALIRAIAADVGLPVRAIRPRVEIDKSLSLQEYSAAAMACVQTALQGQPEGVDECSDKFPGAQEYARFAIEATLLLIHCVQDMEHPDAPGKAHPDIIRDWVRRNASDAVVVIKEVEKILGFRPKGEKS